MNKNRKYGWFDPYLPCLSCGKLSQGVLTGPTGEGIGCYCEKCAEKLLKEDGK